MIGKLLISNPFFTHTLHTHYVHLKDTPLGLWYSFRQLLTTQMQDTVNQTPQPKCVFSSTCTNPTLCLGSLSSSSYLNTNLSQLFLQVHSQLLSQIAGEAENFNNQLSSINHKHPPLSIYASFYLSTTFVTTLLPTITLPKNNKTSPLLEAQLLWQFSPLPTDPLPIHLPPLCSSSFLPLSPLQCSSLPHHPSRHLIPVFITHKPRKKPPHAFLAVVMDRFQLQKMMANKTKLNLKNMLCSYYCGDLMFGHTTSSFHIEPRSFMLISTKRDDHST